jgi:hypothetical protein
LDWQGYSPAESAPEFDQRCGQKFGQGYGQNSGKGVAKKCSKLGPMSGRKYHFLEHLKNRQNLPLFEHLNRTK